MTHVCRYMHPRHLMALWDYAGPVGLSGKSQLPTGEILGLGAVGGAPSLPPSLPLTLYLFSRRPPAW